MGFTLEEEDIAPGGIPRPRRTPRVHLDLALGRVDRLDRCLIKSELAQSA
jgi:hypothetical protein